MNFWKKIQHVLAIILFLLFVTITLASFGMSHATREEVLSKHMNLTLASFKELYEKNYPCTFLQCMIHRENTGMALSAQGNSFFSSMKWFLLLGVVLTAGLLAVHSHTTAKAIRNIGIWTFFLGLLVFIPFAIPPFNHNNIQIDTFIAEIFYPLQPVLIAMMVIGCALFITGIYLHKKEKHEHRKRHH